MPSVATMTDGQPWFIDHDGQPMSRYQWLEATAPDRKAKFIEALTAPEDPTEDDA